MRVQGIRRKMYCFACDKPFLDKKALQLRRSLDEIKKLLACGRNKK